jgi:HEAT repeat protein
MSPADDNEVERSAPGAGGAATEPAAADASPYRNLWVPLLVVPAGIVMVLLCVFLFFGAISGSERTLDENLALVVNGGANERKQAAFSLGAQIAENQRAQLDGREPPWPLDAGFLTELERAWRAVPEDDHQIRLALACLQAQGGDPAGIAHLVELAELPIDDDPEGTLRFQALAQLGASGDPAARAVLIRALDDPDAGLRSIAAIGLQRQAGDEAREALFGALGDPAFDVRANAALALALLGDERAAETLLELADPATYEREREASDGRRFARATLVSSGRASAVQALGRLGRPQDRALLSELAEGDDDLDVREAALRALAERE